MEMKAINKDLFFDTSNIYAYAGIIATMWLLPGTITDTNLLISIAVVLLLYILWMLLTGKKGYTLIVLSISMCIPVVFSYLGVSLRGTDYLLTIYRTGLILIFFFQMQQKRKVVKYPGFIYAGLLYVALYIIYGLIVTPDRLYYNAVHFLIYIVLPFIICSNEKLSFDFVYKGATIMILITCVYSILQFHNVYNPYGIIYSDEIIIDYVRAYGLLGNSLILTGALMFYSALCFIQLLRNKRIFLIVALLALYTALITLSRTAFIVLFIQLIVYLVIARKSMQVIAVVMVFTLLLIVGDFYFGEQMSDLSARFSEGRMDMESSDFHRLAAYYSVMNMFSDNLLGVCPEGVSDAMREYASVGLIRNFTLDNLFLKHIASFGVLFIIPVCYIFYPLGLSYRRRHEQHFLWTAVFMLFLTLGLLGFSFCIDAYPNMNALFYGFAGYMFTTLTDKENMVIIKRK